VPEISCTDCGQSLAESARYCDRCGKERSGGGATVGLIPLESPRRGRSSARLVVAAIAVTLIVVLGVAGYFLYYVPTYDVVHVTYGGWAVDGANPSYPPGSGCGDCGKVVPMGSQFVIHLNFLPQSSSCGYFGCPSYTVHSVSVDPPYTLISISPAISNQYVGPGQYFTWTLTVQAPDSPGTNAIGGIIVVS
jgi:hypothetical protein